MKLCVNERIPRGVSVTIVLYLFIVLAVLGLLAAEEVVATETSLTGEVDPEDTAASRPGKGQREIKCSIDKGYRYNNTDHVIPSSLQLKHYLSDMCGIEFEANACYPSEVNSLHFALDPNPDGPYQQAQREYCGDYAETDVVSNSFDLYPLLQNDTAGFVLHQYLWHRIHNPLRALEEWVRVVSSGGRIAFIVPRKGKRTNAPQSSFYESPAVDARPTSITDLERIYNHTTEATEAAEGPHVFTPKLITDIMRWFNRKHLLQKTALYPIVFRVHDDRDGQGHLAIWQVVKKDLRNDELVFH